MRKLLYLAVGCMLVLTLTCSQGLGGSVPVLSVTNIQTTGAFNGVSVGDANNDGSREIVVARDNGVVDVYDLNGTTLSLLAKNSNSAWTWKSLGVAVGDADNDGSNEIVEADSDGWFRVWKLNGTTFTGVTQQYTGVANDVAIGDANNDGKNEIVVGQSDWFSVWKLNGTTLTSVAAFQNYGGNNCVAIGDANNDGENEIAVAQSDGWFSVWKLNVTTFTGVSSFRTWVANNGVVVGDADNDGYNEVVGVDGAEWLWVFDSVGTNLVPLTLHRTWVVNNGVSVGDADNDGSKEVVVARADNTLTILDLSLVCDESASNLLTQIKSALGVSTDATILSAIQTLQTNLATANTCLDALDIALGVTDACDAPIETLYMSPGQLRAQEGLKNNPNAVVIKGVVQP